MGPALHGKGRFGRATACNSPIRTHFVQQAAGKGVTGNTSGQLIPYLTRYFVHFGSSENRLRGASQAENASSILVARSLSTSQVRALPVRWPPSRGRAKLVAVQRAANNYHCHLRRTGSFGPGLTSQEIEKGLGGAERWATSRDHCTHVSPYYRCDRNADNVVGYRPDGHRWEQGQAGTATHHFGTACSRLHRRLFERVGHGCRLRQVVVDRFAVVPAFLQGVGALGT